MIAPLIVKWPKKNTNREHNEKFLGVMNWVSRLVKSLLVGLAAHTAVGIPFHTWSWAVRQHNIEASPFISVLVWQMLLIISQTGCCLRCLESDQPALQPQGAAWRASDLLSALGGSAGNSGISGFLFWRVVAHAVCPWLVTCSRAVPGIA